MILKGLTSTGQNATREANRFERINENAVMPAIKSNRPSPRSDKEIKTWDTKQLCVYDAYLFLQ